jgi:hypothetical protein
MKLLLGEMLSLIKCKPNLTFLPSLAYEPYLKSLSSSLPNFFISDHILVSSLDDGNEDENPPPPIHLPQVGSIEYEPTLAP